MRGLWWPCSEFLRRCTFIFRWVFLQGGVALCCSVGVGICVSVAIGVYAVHS